MKYAIIENNKIVNIAVADTYLAINWVQLQDGFGIGDNYVNGVFSKEILPIQVPQTITPRQARLILLQYGLLDDIELLIKDNRTVQIWWEYSTDIQRNNEQLLEFAAITGLTDEQLDDMFIKASKL